MRKKLFISLIVLIISFPNEIQSFQRCPEHGSTDFPTINYYPDERFCNVYHKCNCTRTACHAVESHVCPIAQVYSRTEETCLDLEEESCKTTYIQWVQTHSTANQTAMNITDSLAPSKSSQDFQCTSDKSGKFSDPNICNIFHVCTTRNDRTIDQPFLCPYPTVFKIGRSGKMFCAYPNANDCQGKAFYHPMENRTHPSKNGHMYHEHINHYRLPENTLMIANCVKEGLYADSIYCNAYHKCTTNGRDEQYICENQLLFNLESNICDYPINVVCGGKGLLRRPSDFSNGTQLNSSTIMVYGTELRPECPLDVSNILVADKTYCNIFYHCQSGRGSIYMCRDGSVFDSSNTQSVSSCRSEDLVNCVDRLILTPQGIRPAKIMNKTIAIGRNLHTKYSNFILLPSVENQKEVINVPFDCRARIDGHWRDARFCDVFHACLSGVQKRSYRCTQVAERFYFDDVTQKCEFVSRNSNGCRTNQYYGPIEHVKTASNVPTSPEEPVAPWKTFIQSREQFTCTDKQDGFYASRWCNVFYRCYTGIASAFLCPKMPSGARLWWRQHGSPQGVPQESASCTWPCESGRRCSSPGGIVVDNGLSVGESQFEAETVYSQSLCTSAGKDSASQTPLSSSEGLISINSDVSCIGQADGVFLSSNYCNVFHRCVDGMRRDFRCSRATNTPYDLWWNEQTQQCDWPCRIPCTNSVYGTSTNAEQIRSENAVLFRHECSGYQQPSMNQATVYSSNGQPIQTSRSLTSRLIENPDPNFICVQIGRFPTRRYCNVYYECTEIGLPPSQTYECIDSFFDRSQGLCISKDQVPCLGGIYPFDSVPIDRNPDSLQCSTNSGFQLHTSRQFCNIYYLCDGTQTVPTTFRCFNRQTQEEGIYDPFAERCDSRQNFNCQNAIFNFTQIQSYRSLEIDHTHFSDLSTLPCKYDQSYIIEHEQYCNLYHLCKQGEYRLYACIANNDHNQMTSYFYQPNGQCAAPLANLCPRTKTVFSYERLLSNANNDNFQAYLMPDQPQQNNFGSIAIQERVEPTPPCRLLDNYIIPHDHFCNLFYGCKEGELILYACIDRSTNSYGGVFQASTGNCIASNDCGVKEFFRPNQLTTSRPNTNNNLFRSYTMLEASNETRKINDSLNIQSTFSCLNRRDGYYESEWCNIFYRCFGGIRYNERCSSSGDYDLWWKHQSIYYNRTNPQYFGGLDTSVRCDWPCKIKCKKPIWISKENTQGSAEEVIKQDQEQRPACLLIKNRRIEHSKQLTQQMIMYSDIPNPSNFTCPGNIFATKVRFIDPKYCNVFHECTNSKLIGSFLCIESQFNSKESDCVPLSMNNNCPIERRFIVTRTGRLGAQSTLSAYYEAVEVRNVNPSGYECITDGIHTDPMFCNLFHACSGRTRRTFQCRQTGTDGINEGVSTFDLNSKSCSRFSSYSCPTLLYNQEFLILPVMFKPPTVSPCGREGFFPVSDVTSQYCHMFAWCSKGHGEAKVFECVPSTPGISSGAFDISGRSCTSRISCPHARQASSYNTSLLATTLKPKVVSISNRQQFSLTSTMLENGYIALGSDFQTTFTCPLGSTGFYSNPNYCDVFHYCYETGEVSSFVCASMPNRYQLWWSHHNEPGRPDNVFCDWPCNLQGVYACPAHKSILMRDRQPNGNVGQNEVLEATCSSAQVPTVPLPAPVNNYNTPEPIGIMPSTYFPAPLPNMNNNYQPTPSQAPPGISSTALGYQPCVQSQEWFVSQTNIRCSPAFATTGFAPDPKDCSKYYACDSYIGLDGMSNGILMQCLAGLWWDQQRRTCVLPSEVACNPYNIINSQGQGLSVDINPNVANPQPLPLPSPSPVPAIPISFAPIDTTPMVFFPSAQPVAPIGGVPSSPPNGALCRGVPLCIDVGLNILQQMKAIPGRQGWFYKCDSQCALEMRCPPGLVFDDVYQRCEWPGMKISSPNHRLGSLRKKMLDKQANSTASSGKKLLEP